MFEGMNYIELSGEQYPIKCDLLVLERLQEEFGTLTEFERRILNWGYADGDEKKRVSKLPDVKAVNEALYWMMQEGAEIRAEQSGEKMQPMEKTQVLRLVDKPLSEIAGELHEEFARCFQQKNALTTQREMTEKTKD